MRQRLRSPCSPESSEWKLFIRACHKGERITMAKSCRCGFKANVKLWPTILLLTSFRGDQESLTELFCLIDDFCRLKLSLISWRIFAKLNISGTVQSQMAGIVPPIWSANLCSIRLELICRFRHYLSPPTQLRLAIVQDKVTTFWIFIAIIL